jgi:hypothetical protein
VPSPLHEKYGFPELPKLDKPGTSGINGMFSLYNFVVVRFLKSLVPSSLTVLCTIFTQNCVCLDFQARGVTS